MKTKLTLSLPEKTIQEAKQIASTRNISVSALFAESVKMFKDQKPHSNPDGTDSGMSDLLGVLNPTPSFDARSEHIRQKHG